MKKTFYAIEHINLNNEIAYYPFTKEVLRADLYNSEYTAICQLDRIRNTYLQDLENEKKWGKLDAEYTKFRMSFIESARIVKVETEITIKNIH